jgi:hypothetical protein
MLASLVTLLALAVPPIAAAQPHDPAIDAQILIDLATAAEALPAGTERIGDVRQNTLRQGQARPFNVTLDAGRCYVVIARGGPGVENVDVQITRRRAVLATDETGDRTARARWCAGERAEPVRVTVRAFRGAGRYAVSVHREPAGRTVESPVIDAQGFALERLSTIVAAHRGPMVDVTVPAREMLAEGQRIERNVTLASGRCYRVVAAGEAGVADLDVELLAPSGDAMQADASDDAQPTLGVLRPLCPGVSGVHRVALRVERGGGAVAWQVLGTPLAGAAAQATQAVQRFRVGGAGTDFLAERIRARHREVGQGRTPVVDVVLAQLGTGESRRFEVDVEGGLCYVALAAAVPSARELDLRVLDDHGNERGHDSTTDAFPSVRFCPSVSTRYTVEVRMFAGYGRFAAQVFSGPP